MITNNYSTGCLAYYSDMSHPVYVSREESNATMNITNSGYYNICVIPLPSSAYCLDSVFISVEPSELHMVCNNVYITK